jgi:surfeit locus 1 family protein
VTHPRPDTEEQRSEARPAGRRFRPGLWPTLGTIVGLAILLALGTWQYRKYRGSLEREQKIAERSESTSETIRNVEDFDPQALDHRRVELVGTFRPEPLHLIKHRIFDGRPGYWVVQPFELVDGGVLPVNRGWVPLEEPERYLERLAPPQGGSIEGLVHTPDRIVADESRRGAPSFETLEGGRRYTEWSSFDLEGIVSELEGRAPSTASVVVLGERYSAEDFPKASHEHVVEPFLTPERHLTYAMTWFLVALSLLGIYLAASFGLMQSAPARAGAPRSGDEDA